jgi:hypothetical protein
MTQGIETRLDGETLVVRIPMRFQRRGGRKLPIIGHVRDRPEGLNEADTKAKAALHRPDPERSRLGAEIAVLRLRWCDVRTEGGDQSIRRGSKGSAAPDEHLPGDGLGSADETFRLSCGPPIV